MGNTNCGIENTRRMYDFLVNKKISKTISTPKEDEEQAEAVTDSKVIEDLKEVQVWALMGICIVKLPTVEECDSEESELSLLRYCYYRLIYHIADNIINKTNDGMDWFAEKLLSSPFGCCVSKECVKNLCSSIMDSAFRDDSVFGQWTVKDVAGAIRTILSKKCSAESLLKAAIDDYDKFIPAKS